MASGAETEGIGAARAIREAKAATEAYGTVHSVPSTGDGSFEVYDTGESTTGGHEAHQAKYLKSIQTLSPAEKKRLNELESVVQAGVNTFVEVGHALLEIREQQLYRATHMTFQEYVRDNWNLSRPEAYRMIDAARVVDVLSPIGDTPKNEGQARELAPLLRKGHEHVVEVWQETRAEHGDSVTAAKVRQATSRRLTRIAITAEPEPVAPYREPTDRAVLRANADVWIEMIDACLRMTKRLGENPSAELVEAVPLGKAKKRFLALSEAIEKLQAIRAAFEDRAEKRKPQ